jgi:hypothetical protein
MKKIVVLMTVVVFMFGMTAFTFAAEKCDKCHKGEKAVAKIVKAKKIATGEDLAKILRTGPKASLHKSMSDADIAAEVKVLKLKIK